MPDDFFVGMSLVSVSFSRPSLFFCFQSAHSAAGICGESVIWFDYQLREKECYKGFIYEAHRVSN
jgi:hypothetical protein